MKNFLIAAATLATAVSAATPAAAQWYPQQPQQQYGYGYNNYGNGSRLEQRVQMIRREVRDLDRHNRLSNREARQLDREAQFLQQRIQRLAYGGVNPNERYYVERQIAQLESRVRREAMDGNDYYGQNRAYGYNSYGNNGYNGYGSNDRDHDGRDDGQEHQRWHDKHDGNDDHDD